MNSILKKFIEFAFGNGIALILGLISSPIITRLISPEEYGKFSNFNMVSGLFCMGIVFGLDQAYVRFFYEEEESSRKTLLKECIKLPIIALIVLGLVSIVFYQPLSRFILGEANINIVYVLILHTLFCILYTFSILVIRMHQRGKIYSVIQIITKILYIGLVLGLFAIYDDSYWTLILAIVLSNLFVMILAIILEKNEWNFIKVSEKIKTTKGEMYRYAYPLLFAASISWIFQSIDKVFLNIYTTGKTEVGLYGSAFSIIALLNACQQVFTTFWAPVANERYISNKEDTQFFTKMNKYVVVLMCSIAIMIIGGKDIIVILLGNQYRDAVFIIPFLSLMPIMYTISEVTVVGISFKKKTKYHIVVASIAAVINILGNYMLVPILGAKGAAISTGISYIVFYAVRTFISTRLYKVNYNVGKFTLVVISMVTLATYSTLYKFDWIILLMSIGCLAIIIVLYNDVVKEMLNGAKTIIKKLDRKNR